MIVDGFDGTIQSPENPQGILKWYCAPDSWQPKPLSLENKNDKDQNNHHQCSKREGRDGKWYVEKKTNIMTRMTHDDNNDWDCALVVYPAAKKDFWRRTYYEPLLIKDDGAILYASLEKQKLGQNPTPTPAPTTASGSPQSPLTLTPLFRHYTVETSFELYATCQFDQAGVVIRLDAEHWIKTGIEVVDHQARLSCVVTNVYSDWSTQPWPSQPVFLNDNDNNNDKNIQSNNAGDENKDISPNNDANTTRMLSPSTTPRQFQKVQCTIRVHCRGTSFVVEVWSPSSLSSSSLLSSSSNSSSSSTEKEGGGGQGGTWEFVRIAHLSDTMVVTAADPAASSSSSSSSGEDAMATTAPESKDCFWAGVFACCPEDQQGAHVKFTSFRIQEGSNFDHTAESNLE